MLCEFCLLFSKWFYLDDGIVLLSYGFVIKWDLVSYREFPQILTPTLRFVVVLQEREEPGRGAFGGTVIEFSTAVGIPYYCSFSVVCVFFFMFLEFYHLYWALRGCFRGGASCICHIL